MIWTFEKLRRGINKWSEGVVSDVSWLKISEAAILTYSSKMLKEFKQIN